MILREKLIKTCVTACNANYSFIFKWMEFIFSTMIAYEVYLTTKVSHHLDVIGQGHIYLISLLPLVRRAPLSFLMSMVHILLNVCLWCVDDNNCFRWPV